MPIKAPILKIRLGTICRSKKTLGAQSGFMLAIMLAVLGLMLVTGVVLSRLMTTSQLTTQIQQAQRGQQQMQTLIAALAAAASDGDNDQVLEAPASASSFGVPTGYGSTKDVFGTAFRYCAYDYGNVNSSTGRITGNKTTLNNSWVAIALISAGPDRVFQTTTCPATDTDVANARALGDDSILTRSYGDLISFGNKTYADKLNGTFGAEKLCRVTGGQFVCNQTLPSVTCTATQRLIFNGSNYVCKDFVDASACAANQWQRWNSSTGKFECQPIVGAAACGTTPSFIDAGVLTAGIPQGVRWKNSSNLLECYNPIGATGDQGNQGLRGKDMRRCKDYGNHQHNPGTSWWEGTTCSWHTCASDGSGTISWTDNNFCDGCGTQAGSNRNNGDNWTVTCPPPATTSNTYYCYDGGVYLWSGTGSCP